MLGDPDSTQTMGRSTSSLNGTEPLRFIKPCVGEISDVMPQESEIDPKFEQIEPPQYFLRTIIDELVKSEIPLKKYAPIYVGRALGCQIDLVEPSVSRRHCVLQHKDLIVDSFGNTVSGYMVYDLKSAHGTFLNGERIPSMENIKLKHGDKITLGQCATEFVFLDSKHNTESDRALQQQQQQQQQTPVKINLENVHNDMETLDDTAEQIPSSTSHAAESEDLLNESEVLNESWLPRYIKILYQLADSAKEYEEYGVPVPNFDMNSRLAKKFKLEHTKLVQQAQIVADLLALFEKEDEQETKSPPVKRKASSELEAPKAKRVRKSRKVETKEVVEKIKGKRGRKKVTKEPAVKVQNEEESGDVILVHNQSKQSLYDRPTANILNRYTRPSFDVFSSNAEEEDPLAISQEPKIEELFENESKNVKNTSTLPINKYKVQQEPKKRGGRKKKVDLETRETSEPVTQKKRRSRKPKETVKENKKGETEETPRKQKTTSRKTTPKSVSTRNLRTSHSNKSNDSPKKATPLKQINSNSPKRGRGRKKKNERVILVKSAESLLIGPYAHKLKQPIILLQKLKFTKDPLAL